MATVVKESGRQMPFDLETVDSSLGVAEAPAYAALLLKGDTVLCHTVDFLTELPQNESRPGILSAMRRAAVVSTLDFGAALPRCLAALLDEPDDAGCRMSADGLSTFNARVALKDRAAFDRLYVLAAPKLLACACVFSRKGAKAENALQDVFVKSGPEADRYAPKTINHSNNFVHHAYPAIGRASSLVLRSILY